MPGLIPVETPKMTGEMFESLKAHILRQREKRKQEQEQDAAMERHRREQEQKRKQDALSLQEIKEQLVRLEVRVKRLQEEKQGLFLQLKKVLNDDDLRKKQRETELLLRHQQQQQLLAVQQQHQQQALVRQQQQVMAAAAAPPPQVTQLPHGYPAYPYLLGSVNRIPSSYQTAPTIPDGYRGLKDLPPDLSRIHVPKIDSSVPGTHPAHVHTGYNCCREQKSLWKPR